MRRIDTAFVSSIRTSTVQANSGLPRLTVTAVKKLGAFVAVLVVVVVIVVRIEAF